MSKSKLIKCEFCNANVNPDKYRQHLLKVHPNQVKDGRDGFEQKNEEKRKMKEGRDLIAGLLRDDDFAALQKVKDEAPDIYIYALKEMLSREFNPYVNALIGLEFLNFEEFDDAEVAFKRALRTYNNSKGLYLALATVYISKSDYAEARKTVEALLNESYWDSVEDDEFLNAKFSFDDRKIDPREIIQNKLEISESYLADLVIGVLNDTETDLENAILKEPEDLLVNVVAGYFLNNEDIQKKAIELQPDSMLAHAYRALWLLESDRIEESIEECSICFKLEDKSALPHVILGDAYVQQDEFEKALHCFKKAYTLKSDVPTGLKYAHLNIGSENFRETEKIYKECIKHNPEHGEALFDISSFYFSQDKPHLAERYLIDLKNARGSKEDSYVDFMKACIYYEIDELEDAESWVNRAIEFKDGLLTRGYLLLGKIECEQGMLDVLETFNRAIESNSVPETYLDASDTLFENGYYEEAISITERGLAKFPELAKFYFNQADIYAEMACDVNDMDLIDKAFESLKKCPDNGVEGELEERYDYLLSILIDLKNYSKCESIIEDYLLDTPFAPKAKHRLSFVLRMNGKNEKAEAVYKELLKEDPENIRLYHDLATLLIKSNKKALEWVEKGLSVLDRTENRADGYARYLLNDLKRYLAGASYPGKALMAEDLEPDLKKVILSTLVEHCPEEGYHINAENKIYYLDHGRAVRYLINEFGTKYFLALIESGVLETKIDDRGTEIRKAYGVWNQEPNEMLYGIIPGIIRDNILRIQSEPLDKLSLSTDDDFIASVLIYAHDLAFVSHQIKYKLDLLLNKLFEKDRQAVAKHLNIKADSVNSIFECLREKEVTVIQELESHFEKVSNPDPDPDSNLD